MDEVNRNENGSKPVKHFFTVSRATTRREIRNGCRCVDEHSLLVVHAAVVLCRAAVTRTRQQNNMEPVMNLRGIGDSIIFGEAFFCV